MHLSSFIHQKSYEKIEYQVRRHPITLVPVLLLFILLALAPLGVRFLLQAVSPDLLTGSYTLPLVIVLTSAYYLSIGLFLYTYFVTFYLDLLIVTNDRLLKIDQQGLFARTVSELDLCNVQDVTSDVHGFFPSFFHYGTLRIQTASAVERFTFPHIARPEMLRQAILDLSVEDKKYQNSR